MRRPLVIHPFLFALLPVLFLFSHNVEQLSPRVMLAPALVLVAGAFMMWSLLSLILRDWRRAGLVVTLALLLFFTYGHVSHLAVSPTWTDSGGLRHRHLLAIWAGLFALGVYASRWARGGLPALTRFLNVAAVVSVAIPLAGIATYEAKSALAPDRSGALRAETEAAKPAGELPHVYYIILDEYGGDEILREMYDLDNGPFLDSLSQRGFYVARDCRSNYHYSHLALASSLNFEFLSSTAHFRRRIMDNSAFRVFKRCGYRIVGFSSEISYTDLRNVDVYMGPRWAFNEFQNQLMNATPLFLVVSRLSDPAVLHRRHITYTLDHLAEPAKSRKPVFVFAHILCPHPPFGFEEDGSPARNLRFLKFDDPAWAARDADLVEQYKDGYRKQVNFLNRRMTAVIDSILAVSSRPCVIVLQADHGPRTAFYPDNIQKSYLKERFSILNALRFPEGDYSDLYQSISPVNTFRVIFNRYFGTNYQLLEDRSFLTPPEAPTTLLEVTAAVADSSAVPPR